LPAAVVRESVSIAEEAISSLYYFDDQANQGSLVTGMLTRLRHQVLSTVGAEWNGTHKHTTPRTH
jgi:hypothetical protein